MNLTRNSISTSKIEWDIFPSNASQNETQKNENAKKRKQPEESQIENQKQGVDQIVSQESIPKKQRKQNAKNDSEISISLPIKGRPVSGRPWKEDETKRSSSRIMKPPSCHPSWEEKLQERKEKESLKLKENELKEQKKEEIEKRKKLREEKKKRKEQNELKSSVFQVITNTQKIKKMGKKQLKNIKKM